MAPKDQPPDTPEPEFLADPRVAELRRYRWTATFLLVLMAGIFLATETVEDAGFWILLIRAGAEAAMVGGLADWFAVTALFRHPLGIPIPHTAVIPNNKDRIGIGLGQFVERNFLAPDLVTQKLRSVEPARRIGAWLADRRNADMLAERLAGAAPALLASLGDKDVRHFLARALERQIAAIDLAGVLGRGIEILRESDRHHELFDQIVRAARAYLIDNQERIYEAVEDRSAWWVPRRVDKRVARALILGMAELLEDLMQRDHPVRLQFEARLDRFVEELRTDPKRRAQVAAIQRELVENPRTQAYLGEVWSELRALLLRDVEAGADSVLRQALAGGVASLGTALTNDAEMRERLDHRIEGATKTWILPWRSQIGHFIADVVKSWDARTVAERVETAVGRDLQYIRINGTLVGGLVGIGIFLLSWYVL